MLMLVLIGLLFICCLFDAIIMMLFILIALEMNMFVQKSDILLEIKTCKQTYSEYK